MWGFCSAWLWDKVEEFMRIEKFVPASYTQEQWDHLIATAGSDMNLQRNPKAGILCVLAKAKSLRTGTWVFQGISASPAPM